MLTLFESFHGGALIYLLVAGAFLFLIIRAGMTLYRQECRRSHEKFVLCMLIVLCMVSAYLNYETAQVITAYEGQVSRLAIGTMARVTLECIMFYEVLAVFSKRKKRIGLSG